MAVVCMIPVRKGSSRVPGKGLRVIGGITLLEQAIELALTFFKPSEVYLNTDWEELEPISREYNIRFFRRDNNLCTSSATNDDFMEDFLKKAECSRVVQLLPTSPFLPGEEFRAFCDRAVSLDGTNTSIVSVSEHRIACIKEDGQPINFKRNAANPPSQSMEAVFSYATCLMSWSKEFFLESMTTEGYAYHGDKDNEYFKLSFMAQLDIDTEQDLASAMSIASVLPCHRNTGRYVKH